MAFIDKQSQEISNNAKVTRKDKERSILQKVENMYRSNKNFVAFTTKWPNTLLRVLKKTTKEWRVAKTTLVWLPNGLHRHDYPMIATQICKFYLL